MGALLSKSKYLIGLQCDKYLWVYENNKNILPEPDTATQYRFEQGRLVGELAKRLFSGGVSVPTDDFKGNLEITEELLKQRKTIFEAGITAAGYYCRPDVLKPAGNGTWDIIEVKSSIQVKDVNIHDVAFQRMCCLKYGLEIGSCYLLHINNSYIKDGAINPEELLHIEDITSEVIEASCGIEDRLRHMREVLALRNPPTPLFGKHCLDPYDCPLKEKCWAYLPDNNTLQLRNGGNKKYELFADGVIYIKDIPPDTRLTDAQTIQKECASSGEPHIETLPVRSFLGELKYPMYYLDFETMAPVVPLYDGTRPYQKVPFQFSLHVLESESAGLKHFEYLGSGKEDPRPEFINKLAQMLGNRGSIIAYNANFEKGVLKELAKAYPQYAEWVDSLMPRVVDLLVPFRKMHYYHPAQMGSASIKKVLPVLTGRGYEEMEIGAGNDASIAFEEISSGKLDEEEAEEVKANLLKYCKLDTEAMVLIVDKLREITG